MATMTAREFAQDVSAAKREANSGPVVITDRGRPAYVLLSIDEYRRMGQSGETLVDRLSMDDDIDVEFEPVRVELVVPDLRPERDALIAATALVHGLTLVTRNVKDFGSLGVALVNPWT